MRLAGPPGDFETIACRYVALPRNQRTLGNRLRQFGAVISKNTRTINPRT
jgi:hypothetical protein